jgi:hypothetical protein
MFPKKNVLQILGYVTYWELDPGHAANQIGKHNKRAPDTRVHEKLGKLCELDPDHVSNQIGQQQKITISNYTLSVKFCHIY